MRNVWTTRGLRSWLGIAAVSAAAALGGCLPQYEELPLTASGEGGESLAAVSGGSSAGSANSSAPACSGVASGNIPGSASLDGKIPCTLQGSVDARNLTPSQRTQVAGIKVLKGTLTVGAQADVDGLKALTSVDNLDVVSFSGATLELPARIAVTNELRITGGKLTIIKGFAGVTALAGQLTIDGVASLTTINAFAALTKAGSLHLNQLQNLTSITGFSALTQLKSLQLTHLTKLNQLPQLPKVTSLANLAVGYCPALVTLSGLPGLTNASSLQLNSLDKVSQVSFPALMTVASFSIDGMALLADLGGFGAQLVVSSQLHICNIKMNAEQREAWRKQHAPNLQFSKCANGCIGMGC